MYKFDVEINGKVVETKYSLRSVYEYVLPFVHLIEPLDIHICEYRSTRLYYSWTLDTFIRYCRKTFI